MSKISPHTSKLHPVFAILVAGEQPSFDKMRLERLVGAATSMSGPSLKVLGVSEESGLASNVHRQFALRIACPDSEVLALATVFRRPPTGLVVMRLRWDRPEARVRSQARVVFAAG